ncbi:hypothetical protein RCIROH_79 [Rhodobacter phage RcIroh]|nr:hypothetical protein RCIROH_79 [Rhodobacter phage RcIroh]
MERTLNERLFTSVKEMAASGYIFRITDNGGASLDRITVIFCDGDYLSLSETGAGVSMWGEGIDVADWNDRVEAGTEVDLAIGDLRPELQDHILRRVNEAWQDYLDALADPQATAVAQTRDKAEVNEGTHDSGGKGIYAAGSGFCVRLDGEYASDDRGPFQTARQALAATLPDDYSLSGPEYHSALDVSRLKPTPGIKAKLRRLEKKAA